MSMTAVMPNFVADFHNSAELQPILKLGLKWSDEINE